MDKEEAVAQYVRGTPVQEILQKAGLSKTTFYRLLKKCGVDLRPVVTGNLIKPVQSQKECAKCKTTKTSAEFTLRGTRLHPWCIECKRQYMAAAMQKLRQDPEWHSKELERKREHRLLNREHLLLGCPRHDPDSTGFSTDLERAERAEKELVVAKEAFDAQTVNLHSELYVLEARLKKLDKFVTDIKEWAAGVDFCCENNLDGTESNCDHNRVRRLLAALAPEAEKKEGE